MSLGLSSSSRALPSSNFSLRAIIHKVSGRPPSCVGCRKRIVDRFSRRLCSDSASPLGQLSRHGGAHSDAFRKVVVKLVRLASRGYHHSSSTKSASSSSAPSSSMKPASSAVTFSPGARPSLDFGWVKRDMAAWERAGAASPPVSRTDSQASTQSK